MTRYIIYLILSLYNYSVFCQDEINWSNDTVKIYSDFNVYEDETLVINPGVVVEFQGHYSINISGRIEAIGTINDSILFTIADTNGFMNEWNSVGGWHGLRFMEREIDDTSRFEFCRFQYGKSYTYKYDDSDDNKGGVIFANGYSNIIVSNSVFRYSFAGSNGAAIYAQDLKSLKVNGNIFKYNNSKEYGGGVFVKNTRFFLNNNLFYYNLAYRQDTIWLNDTTILALSFLGKGSAVSSENTSGFSPQIVDNQMFNNKSVSGVLWESSKYGNIENNVICNNEDYGFFDGYGYWSNKTIRNNIIVNNYRWVNNYAGVWSISQYHNFTNNIVYGNMSGSSFSQFSSPDLPVEYSCVQDGYPGEGNISSDPQFTSPTEGAGLDFDGLAADWTLLEASPCINTGTPDTTGLNLPEFDLSGNPRVFGGRIDMGAYENQSVYVKINESPVYSRIKLYPNPGSDKIYIDVPTGMEGAWIDIVDGRGKVLMHEQIQTSPSVLSPYKLQSGIYLYRIYKENKVVKSGKWVKR